MFSVIRDIKFIVGLVSTLTILLSAFRFETIPDNDADWDDKANILTIDHKSLEAMAKFDRNVRHLQLKGREASKYDYMNIVPELKESLAAATRILNQWRKLNVNKLDCRGGRNSKNRHKERRTISYSFHFGSNTYQVSFYWPKVLRLFTNSED